MKWMIASDLHGSAYWTRRLVERWKVEQPDRVVLLGDLLYHGPRNDLPDEYSPKLTVELLETLQPRPICVRGNCDAEIDQVVLPFPIMADYGVMSDGAQTVYITHGHLYDCKNPLPMQPGDMMLCGHFHVPACELQPGGWWYVNPGSVSIPKEDSTHEYLIWEQGIWTWKDMDGRVLRQETLK